MTIPKPTFDAKIAERLDNAIAICDTGFALHDGFEPFVVTYFRRPYDTCLQIPSGVIEDISRLLVDRDSKDFEKCVTADCIFEVLVKNGYAETNGFFENNFHSIHGQIVKMVDYLRTNHRVCVLSNSSRLLQSIQYLRRDRREQAKGISCLHLSDKTLKPMVARWYDPATYITSYVG